jgi:hypothetical protein
MKNISKKDLDYISDSLNWNFILFKKLDFFINICEDEDLKKELKKTRDVHKEHYSFLLDILG